MDEAKVKLTQSWNDTDRVLENKETKTTMVFDQFQEQITDALVIINQQS